MLSFRQQLQVKRIIFIREFEEVCIGKTAEFFQSSSFVFIVQKCGDNIQTPQDLVIRTTTDGNSSQEIREDMGV